MLSSARFEFPPMLGPAEAVPIGSPEWAERISRRLQLAVDRLSRETIHDLQRCVTQIFQAEPRPWEVWPDDRRFKTPDEYCKAVTGHPWKALIELMKELGNEQLGFDFRNMEVELAKAQAKHRKRGRPKKENRAHSTNLKHGSTQSVYLLRRLARDHPEILQRYERGEFKSVRAAAIEAGIVKRPSLLEQFCKLITKMSMDDRRNGLRVLEQQVEEDEKAAVSKNQIAMFQ